MPSVPSAHHAVSFGELFATCGGVSEGEHAAGLMQNVRTALCPIGVQLLVGQVSDNTYPVGYGSAGSNPT
jgi:hypothetical protein